MPSFSKSSLSKLNTCEYAIQEWLKNVIMKYDIIVICGYRTAQEQDKAFNEGFSKVKWPNSKHNIYLSRAVDIAPYPYNKYKNDVAKHYEMAAYALEVASEMKLSVVWGGNYQIRKVSKLVDLPHFNLKEK